MKFPAFVLLALSAFALTASAAPEPPRPKGLAGVPWGATPSETRRLLRDKGIEVPDEDDGEYKRHSQKESGETVEGTGGTFAGQEAVKWSFEFGGGKLMAASVVVRAKGNSMNLYREFKREFYAKYGGAVGERKLANGYASTWKFGPIIGDRNTLSIVLQVANESDSQNEGTVTARYANETMVAAAAKAAATAVQSSEKTPVKPGAAAVPPKGKAAVKLDDL